MAAALTPRVRLVRLRRSTGDSHEFRQRQHRGRQRPGPRGPHARQWRCHGGLWRRRHHAGGSRATFAELFERDVAVFLVTTGTAANALALSAAVPPWGLCVCHEEAHVIDDECGAPEFFTHGAKLVGLPGAGSQARCRARSQPYLAAPAPVRQADAAEGPVDLAGDGMRAGLRPRRDRRPGRGVPGARPQLSTWTARVSPTRSSRSAARPPR